MISFNYHYSTESMIADMENKILVDNKKNFIGRFFTYMKDYITGKRISDTLKKINQKDLITIHNYEIEHIKKAYSNESYSAIHSLIETIENELLNRQLLVSNSIPTKEREPSSTIEKIEPKEIINLLNFLENINLSSEAFEKAYQKYGSRIIDSRFLLSEIEKIQDPNIRRLASKKLFYFQMIILGHEIGIGGKIKLYQKNLSLKEEMQTLKEFIQDGFQTWKIDIEKGELNLEGNYPFVTHLKLIQSLNDFFSNFSKTVDPELQKSIIYSFESTANIRDAISFEKQFTFNVDSIVKDIQAGKTVTLPTGWQGHGTTITISGDKLAYANRGKTLDPKAPKGIEIYSIGNPNAINRNFLLKVIRKSFFTSDQMNFLENKTLETGMHKLLKLQPIHFIEKKRQKIGNCSWASVKCAFQAQLFMHEYNKISKDPNVKQDEVIKLSSEKANTMYKAWNIQLRKSEFLDFIDFLKKNNAGYQIFSKKEEFLLMSQFFDKFFTINKKEKYNDIMELAGFAMQDLSLQFFEEKDYSIEDGIISLNEIKDLDKRKLVPNVILGRKLPGSFMITKENKDDLKIHYRKQKSLESPIETFSENISFCNGNYYIGASKKPLKSMHELRKFLKENIIEPKTCSPVPVLNQAVINLAKRSTIDRILQFIY